MKIVESGLLSRGAAGTQRALLTFPSLISLTNGVILATYRAGTDKDSPDETIELCRSADGGHTWSAPRTPFKVPTLNGKRGSLKVCYLTEVSPGRLLAAAMWVDRETYPGKPLFNPETEGCLPMAILLASSYDYGETWMAWRHVPLPTEVGPPSLTCPVMKLRDGTLAMSIETNKEYNDRSQWFQRVVFFRSADGGKTWAGPYNSGFDPTGRLFNWDQRAVVAPDGRIVAYTWVYDSQTRQYRNIHRRISADGGLTWGPHVDMGIADQPSHPAILPDGRVVLAWVDRFRSHTIRARLAPSIDDPFDPASEIVLYRHGTARADDADPLGALGGPVWTYGLPYAETLPGGDVMVVYYAGDEAQMDIQYARLRI